MDIAENMFAKCKQLTRSFTPSTAENLADLFYEIGKSMLVKHMFELAVRWLERAYDVLGEQDIEILSSEAGELRLSIMQSISLYPSYAQVRRAEHCNSASTYATRGTGRAHQSVAHDAATGSGKCPNDPGPD
jgi:hypothetical protein